MENLTEKLNWRYGVKRYDTSKKVKQDDIAKLKQAIRFAPSSFGLQPFKVLFIEDETLRKSLSIASYNQPQITEASCLTVFAIETNINNAFVDTYFGNICKTRAIKLEGNLQTHREAVISSVNRRSAEEKRSWATHQAYLALGFFLFAAAELKIDANAMEGFIPSQYDEILGLTDVGLHAVVIAAIGYRHADDIYQHHLKVRRPDNEMFINL